jgi:hypothetical protein
MPQDYAARRLLADRHPALLLHDVGAADLLNDLPEGIALETPAVTLTAGC